MMSLQVEQVAVKTYDWKESDEFVRETF